MKARYRVAGKPRFRQRKILILCQGKTEEVYLSSFPGVRNGSEWSVSINIESLALDPLQLVQRAVALRDREKTRGTGFNQVWCVFDKDDFKKNFREGVQLADAENIHHAFSIESFELWLLLHFQAVSVDSPLDRNDYITELDFGNRLPGYCKQEEWLQQHVTCRSLGKVRRDQALRNSKNLEDRARKRGSVYKKQNCTIHKIVEFLLQL